MTPRRVGERSSDELLPSVVYLPKLQYATFKLTQLVI